MGMLAVLSGGQMMSKSNPNDKKDAVRAMDGNLKDQNSDSTSTQYTQAVPKKQHNAFKIIKGKGVVLTQSIKNKLKQQFECRYSDSYKAFIGPIGKKSEVQAFLSKSTLKVELIDIFADFSKSQKIEGLQTRLGILDEEIYTLFREFIVQAYQHDPKRSYHDFKVEPNPLIPLNQTTTFDFV